MHSYVCHAVHTYMHARTHVYIYRIIYIHLCAQGCIVHAFFHLSLDRCCCEHVAIGNKKCLQAAVQLLGVVQPLFFASCLFATTVLTTLGVHCVVVSLLLYIGFPSLIRTLPNSVLV